MTVNVFHRVDVGTGAHASPALVLSLDFELRWGRRDRLRYDMDAYRENLEGTREVVPRLLELFVERGLRATWATVGAVACRDWDEYFSRAPAPPRFTALASLDDRRFADLDPLGRLHFAPDLVGRVRRSPRQELATHTFSHLAMCEPGVFAGDVAADLTAVQRLWRDIGAPPARSLCFPRNQAAFLDVVRMLSIRVWRGNPSPWYHRRDRQRDPTAFRVLRFLDDVSPAARRATPLEGDMTRASLYLRVTLPDAAWRLQVARIRRELRGIQPGEIFHLWWHPENLGTDVARRLARVREVLDLVAESVTRGAIVSRTMQELVRLP
jgi:hypothetical protein